MRLCHLPLCIRCRRCFFSLNLGLVLLFPLEGFSSMWHQFEAQWTTVPEVDDLTRTCQVLLILVMEHQVMCCSGMPSASKALAPPSICDCWWTIFHWESWSFISLSRLQFPCGVHDYVLSAISLHWFGWGSAENTGFPTLVLLIIQVNENRLCFATFSVRVKVQDLEKRRTDRCVCIRQMFGYINHQIPGRSDQHPASDVRQDM